MKSAFLLFCVCCTLCASAQKKLYAPAWQTAQPEATGLSSNGLNALFDYVRTHQTRVHSLQILRRGKLVLDAYFYPYGPDRRHDVASVTKSITSTLTGIAVDKGFITSMRTPFYQYFPQYPVADSLKKTVTLEDLITMRAGFDCGARMDDPRINYDRQLEQVRGCTDWLRCIFNIPMAGKPGEHFRYCNINCHLLSAVIAKTTGLSEAAFAQQHLFGPLNIRHSHWPADPTGINYGWSDLQLHPYDMLRIGQLMLQKGAWNGRQLVSENWLQKATAAHVTNTGNSDQYGYYWWLPGPAFPDVFEAVGRGGQRITVWPSRQTVIVFTGGGFNTADLIPFIVNAMQADKPIPGNAAAYAQLQANIRQAAVAQVKPATTVTSSPLAQQVSGKLYKFPVNTIAWDSVRFVFNGKTDATMHFVWAGKKTKCRVGLDGKMRFSPNPITLLQQGCTGNWINKNTLRLQLDLIGAINLYNFDVVFADDAATAQIVLSEGTGLSNESITGTLVR